MSLVALLIGIVSVAAGVFLLILARRRRLESAARGEDPGKNVAAGVGVALVAVGLLSIARSF